MNTEIRPLPTCLFLFFCRSKMMKWSDRGDPDLLRNCKTIIIRMSYVLCSASSAVSELADPSPR